jgi:hypothetical protein
VASPSHSGLCNVQLGPGQGEHARVQALAGIHKAYKCVSGRVRSCLSMTVRVAIEVMEAGMEDPCQRGSQEASPTCLTIDQDKKEAHPMTFGSMACVLLWPEGALVAVLF